MLAGKYTADALSYLAAAFRCHGAGSKVIVETRTPASKSDSGEKAVETAARGAASVQRTPSAPPSFRNVFAVREFRNLWLAQVLSVAGDQLDRVAMTVLVYSQTRSAFWAAATYAVTLVPWILGGLALSGLADRLPFYESVDQALAAAPPAADGVRPA